MPELARCAQVETLPAQVVSQGILNRLPSAHRPVCSHMVRAGLLHTIQQRLAGDELVPCAAGAAGRRQGGVPGGGQKHVPLLLRAKEPAVEERLLKIAATKGAGEAPGVAAAAGAAGGGGNGSGPAAEEAAQLVGAQSAAAQ